jgi:hypothetical protein
MNFPTIQKEPLFDVFLLGDPTQSGLPQGYVMRPLEQQDYDKGN